RSFDRDPELLNGCKRIVRQPGVEFLESLFACKDFKPMNLAAAPRGLLDGSIENQLRCFPNVATGPVPLNERNDGVIRNDQFRSAQRDLLAVRGRFQTIKFHPTSRCKTTKTNMRFERMSIEPVSIKRQVCRWAKRCGGRFPRLG